LKKKTSQSLRPNSPAQPSQTVVATNERTQQLGQDLTKGSVVSHIARLSGFMMIGFVANNAAQLVEVAYLGLVGTAELAAIAFTFPATFALHAIGRGLAAGGSSLMARAHGAGDNEQVRRIATHCLWLVVLFSIISVCVGSMWCRAFYNLLGANGLVLDLAVSYSQIFLIGFPTYVLGTVAGLLLRGIGNGAVPGLVMTFGSILQVILGPFLIFGWMGIPAMGIEGAAIAFVLSRFAAFFIAMHWILVREHLVTNSFTHLIQSWKAIAHIGLPASINNLIPPVSAGIVTRLLAEHGDLVVAGFGVATRFELIFWMMMAAVASSVGPVVGQNWGAKHYTRVQETMRSSTAFCLLWGIFTFIALGLFAEPMIRLINQDPIVVDIATTYLVIVALSLGFVGIQNAASFSFNALGKPGPALALSLLRLIVLYVPIAILANSIYGYIGVFYATAAVNVIAGILSWTWNTRTIRHHP